MKEMSVDLSFDVILERRMIAQNRSVSNCQEQGGGGGLRRHKGVLEEQKMPHLVITMEFIYYAKLLKPNKYPV